MPRSRGSWGGVRRTSAGGYQARVTDPDTGARVTLGTWDEEPDAWAAIDATRAKIDLDQWTSPILGRVTVVDWGRQWIDTKPELAPKTKDLYERLLRLHLAPLGDVHLADLSTARIRRWRAQRLDNGVGPSTVAKAYRLLSAMLTTAVADGLIPTNACKIRGAGVEPDSPRPLLTPAQIVALAGAMPDRMSLMVYLGAVGALRIGEVIGLQRQHVLLSGPTVVIEGQIQEINGTQTWRPPKSRAGRRRVALPPSMLSTVEAHLEEWVGPHPQDHLFVGERSGQPLRLCVFRKAWSAARREVGVPGARFHDLRHAGATMAAMEGATIRELMVRLGHSTSAAALRYQHAAVERDQLIADGIGRQFDGFTG